MTPPPLFTIFAPKWVLSSRSFSFMSGNKRYNREVSPNHLKWICPILTVDKTVDVKPPLDSQNFAALEAAATTELSSITIGTAYTKPLIKKLGAIP